MNKKVLISIIVIVLLVVGVVTTFILLDNKNNNTSNSENKAKDILNNNEKDSDDNMNNDNKILVVYFSHNGEQYNVGNVEVGNTAMVASYIKEYLNCDTFEITPEVPYSKVYNEMLDIAKEEQRTNARPKLKNTLSNIDDYDTVFIGYPIWWGEIPNIVYTFLESYNLDNKTIIPFNTHEGSGNAGTYSDLKNKLINSNVNTNGLAITGSTARTDSGKEQTISWLKSLGY